MTFHYSDPEARAELEQRKAQRDLEWLKGQIGDATYLTSLRILRYAERDAKSELNLLRMSKR